MLIYLDKICNTEFSLQTSWTDKNWQVRDLSHSVDTVTWQNSSGLWAAGLLQFGGVCLREDSGDIELGMGEEMAEPLKSNHWKHFKC